MNDATEETLCIVEAIVRSADLSERAQRFVTAMVLFNARATRKQQGYRRRYFNRAVAAEVLGWNMRKVDRALADAREARYIEDGWYAAYELPKDRRAELVQIGRDVWGEDGKG